VDNVILNHKRPPFDKLAIRRAVSLALDRHGFVQGVRQGGAFVGPALMSPPFGAWGLPDKEVKALPGYRAAAQDKAEAKRLLAAAGVSAAPLKGRSGHAQFRDLHRSGVVRRGPAQAVRHRGPPSGRSTRPRGFPRSRGAISRSAPT